MPEPDLWTIEQAAAHIGSASTKSASSTLSRWGIKAAGHEIGADGKARSVFRADEIRNAKAARPGRGSRTDLFPILALLDDLWHRARWADGQTTVTTACGRTGTPTKIDASVPLGVPIGVCATCTRRGMQ